MDSRNFWDRCPKVVLCLASLLVACQDYPGLQFRAESARGSSEFPSKAFQPVSAKKFWQEGRRRRVDPESAHDPHFEFPRELLHQGPGEIQERDLGSRTQATPSSRPSASSRTPTRTQRTRPKTTCSSILDLRRRGFVPAGHRESRRRMASWKRTTVPSSTTRRPGTRRRVPTALTLLEGQSQHRRQRAAPEGERGHDTAQSQPGAGPTGISHQAHEQGGAANASGGNFGYPRGKPRRRAPHCNRTSWVGHRGHESQGRWV